MTPGSSPKPCADALALQVAELQDRLRELEQERDRLLVGEKYFRDLADQTPAMIGMADRDGNLTFVSRQWLEFTDSVNAQNLGQEWLNLVHPEDVEFCKRSIAAAVEARRPYNVHYRLRRKDGEYRWILDKASPRTAENGEFEGYVGIAIDITEMVQAREEKRLLEQRMQQAQKLESLGLLAGGIAHDLNNLLTGVLGSTSMALEALPEGDPVRQQILRVEQAGRQAAELARQMLAFSGRGPFLLEPVDLNAIISGIKELLQATVPKSIELLVQLGADLPAIEADRTQIKQVLLNLVINAAEAANKPGLSIRIRTGSEHCSAQFFETADVAGAQEPGLYVMLEVADSGCGMDEDTRLKVFDPFFTTKVAGRGLGLAAVRGIVKAHNGAIKVESARGQGSCFRVYFPASRKTAVLLAAAARPRVRKCYSGTVLVIDDEEVIRSVSTEMLRRLGFDVLAARDGTSGLKIFFEREDIMLVLLDLTMPGVSGDEILRTIKTRRDVPVLISSGFTAQTAVSRLVTAGNVGFLQKPYGFEELHEQVDHLLTAAGHA